MESTNKNTEHKSTHFKNTDVPSLKIKFLSNVELLSRFGKLVQTERKITHWVLGYIAEIDSRKLYLDRAYPSLYEFLVQEFGYSSSAALRRIESARLLREVPEVAAKIESGALNLSQLSKVQQAVRAAQKLEDRKLNALEKKDLLSRIENTTQQQTELILSQALSLPMTTEDKAKTHRDESVTLTITLSKEQMAILKQAQDLIAHAVPEKRWAETLTYLAQKEVNRRTKPKQTTENQTTKIQTMSATSVAGVKTSTKKIVLNRDRCCQFMDKATGKICGSRRFLQTDHRQSLWAHGTHEISNLQILCASHNQHKYRKESFMR